MQCPAGRLVNTPLRARGNWISFVLDRARLDSLGLGFYNHRAFTFGVFVLVLLIIELFK